MQLILILWHAVVAAALDLPSHRKARITWSAGEMDELPEELIDADLDSLPDTVLDGTSVEMSTSHYSCSSGWASKRQR